MFISKIKSLQTNNFPLFIYCEFWNLWAYSPLKNSVLGDMQSIAVSHSVWCDSLWYSCMIYVGKRESENPKQNI